MPDATVIDEVEAFAKDWGWQIDERADATRASGLCKGGEVVNLFVCSMVASAV